MLFSLSDKYCSSTITLSEVTNNCQRLIVKIYSMDLVKALVSFMCIVSIGHYVHGYSGNPATGTCLCASGRSINVRASPGLSSSKVGRTQTGECFKYQGNTNYKDGYKWYKLDFNGRIAWIAGSLLRLGSSSQCSSGGGSSCASNVKLRDSQARAMVENVGIGIWSSGGCNNRDVRSCTSLDYIRCQCITGIIRLKRETDCPITITGGTETGHSTMTYSHWNGYKLDISLGCVDRFIENYTKAGTRRDGAALYRDTYNVLYAKEGNHWDIVYKN